MLDGETIVGSDAIWGVVEDSASVWIDILRADGTLEAVPAENVAVDQFGYFYARLDQPLEAGDEIIVHTEDFCGNTTEMRQMTTETLAPNAVAELLGADIVGELESGEMAHRYATPIDLAMLAGMEGELELPILAYKGIEIGKAYFALTPEGKLTMRYEITTTGYFVEDSKVRMSVYGAKPTIAELVAGPQTELLNGGAEIDMSAYLNEDGSFSGVVWIAAAFDIQIDEMNYVRRGGRSVNFYRWLESDRQTESVLNAIYEETSAYAENQAYYRLYQAFERLSAEA